MPDMKPIEPHASSPSYEGLSPRSYFYLVNTQQHHDQLMRILGQGMGQVAVESLGNYQVLENALTPGQRTLHEGYGNAQIPGAVL